MGGLPDNAALGGISEATQYWENEPVIPQFRNDGKFFSAYAADAQEGATGTLKSSVFRIGGSGWITYKLGGAKNIEDVYMQVLSEDGSKAVTLPNFIWSDVAGQTVRGCTLVAYKANLIDYGFAEGDRVYILITDNGVSDYGLFFLDSVFTYYTEEPSEDYALASRYMIFNGGFERGNLTGWKISGDVGVVSSDSTYWNNPDKIYDKEGDFLFTWWSWDEKANEGAGAEVNRERNVGTLTSGTFALKSDAIVSFRFGGGGEKQQQIYIEFVDADTGNAVAKFYNTNASEGKLIAYQYRFALEEEIECYIRVVDNATEGWGCFALDDVRVNLASAPEGHLAATNQLLSGSME